MKFKSAVDRWVYLVVVALVLSTAVIPQLISDQSSGLFTVGFFIFIIGLPLWAIASTYYQVSGDLLLIKSGPFSWKVNITEIISAKPSRNLISSPALSLNRIELCYGQGKRILVSPRDPVNFLEAIGHAK